MEDRLILFDKIQSISGQLIRDGDQKISMENLLSLFGDDTYLKYIISGNNGLVFEIVSAKFNKSMVCKIVPRSERFDKCNPENIEITVNLLLNELVIKKHTPHINLLYSNFCTDLDQFLKLHKEENFVDQNQNQYDTYDNFINKYNKHKNANVLITEYAYTDFHKFIELHKEKITLDHWRAFLFQIISTLAVIQDKYPGFRHNCLCPRNILVVKSGRNSSNKYTVCKKKYNVPQVGYTLKINDFDFVAIEGLISNNKMDSRFAINQKITNVRNQYYDMHFFLNCLLHYKIKLPDKIKEFIARIIPDKYRNPLRYQYTYEHMTPKYVLETDELFNQYREISLQN